LIVEDDTSTREVLLQQLRSQKFDCSTATSGAEALTKMADLDFEVVILDLNLTDMNGLEIVKKVKQMRPDQPVLIYTSEELSMEDIDSLDGKLTRYLIKSRASEHDIYSAVSYLLKSVK